jgi:hypothetical protein
MIPFRDVKLRELYSVITDADNLLRPKRPESCPKSLASLIRQCWHIDPERRRLLTDLHDAEIPQSSSHSERYETST